MVVANRFGKQSSAEPPPVAPNAPTPEQAQRIASVEKSRDRLHKAINAYRVLLKETKLSTARTQKDREQQMETFTNLNQYAGELNAKSAEEGSMVLAITALNSVLVLRDELNDLKFQNLVLHKKIKELEAAQASSGE